MKCTVCGSESGKYPLCRVCNIKKEKGEVIKCNKCGKWHYSYINCLANPPISTSITYLYDIKSTLISKSEQNFYNEIKTAVPSGYLVFPQINLASFIERTDNSRFHNELFRNVDFLVTDSDYHPKFVIEINDQTHMNNERKERDEKVKNICEEAGIPILTLWTSYGVNSEYIKKRVDELLSTLPIKRIQHSKQANSSQSSIEDDSPKVKYIPISHTINQASKRQGGCYVATCVYGSYDCSEVWVLRRYRDNVLSNSFLGKIFIKTYYAISPIAVKWFGKQSWFVSICKSILDKIVSRLQSKGFENTPYND